MNGANKNTDANDFTSPTFWKDIDLLIIKEKNPGVPLDIYDERENIFSEKNFKEASFDLMQFYGINLLLNICKAASIPTATNPMYWYNAQIQEDFEFSSLLKRDPKALTAEEKDLLWSACLEFFERYYSGPRYIYRQRVLWDAISIDFELFEQVLTDISDEEIIHMNMFTRFLAAHIGGKMRNIEGDH